MTDDIYKVLNRINEIKNRFGLKRHNQMNNVKPKENFNNILTKSLGKDKVPELKININDETKNSGKYSKNNINKLVDYYAGKNRVSSSLMKSLINVESGYDPDAVSQKGAAGLMQLMPSVIKDMNVNNPFKPEENINAGIKHFKGLLESFNGDYKKALSAYNAGKGAVLKHNGVPEYKETRDYVEKVLKNYIKNK